MIVSRTLRNISRKGYPDVQYCTLLCGGESERRRDSDLRLLLT